MITKKLKAFIFLFFFVFFLLNFTAVLAKVNLKEQTSAFVANTSLDNQVSVVDMVSYVIKAFLGLLGIIFVGLIVYAGYNWMTASGESEKIETAQKTIKRAIIGLIITISAYSITYFVLSNLPSAGSGGNNTSGATGSPSK